MPGCPPPYQLAHDMRYDRARNTLIDDEVRGPKWQDERTR
jgi:hypothetical protein